MGSSLYARHVPDLVAKGEVPMARVDEAVLRVLATKEALGLFERPFGRIDPARSSKRVFTREHLVVARDAARRSIVMLKNEGELLPLPRSGKRLALIGPVGEGQANLSGLLDPFCSDKDAIDPATGIRAGMANSALLSVLVGSGVREPLAGGAPPAEEQTAEPPCSAGGLVCSGGSSATIRVPC